MNVRSNPEEITMIKWNHRSIRIALVLSSVAAFAVGSGASLRWG